MIDEFGIFPEGMVYQATEYAKFLRNYIHVFSQMVESGDRSYYCDFEKSLLKIDFAL